jgi:hypothetical protein
MLALSSDLSQSQSWLSFPALILFHLKKVTFYLVPSYLSIDYFCHHYLYPLLVFSVLQVIQPYVSMNTYL